MLSVIVPYRPDGGHRDRSWEWVRSRWEALLPRADIVIGTDDGGSSPGEFNHPLAINRAVADSVGDVLLIADADTAFDPLWVERANLLVEYGEAPWIMPMYYDKLTERFSSWVLEQDPRLIIEPTADDIDWRGSNVSWAGLIMVSRTAFNFVGGYDERFAWWGADDVAFGLTMDALIGRHLRLKGSAFHLWHPQPASDTQHPHSAAQNRLVEKYKAAAGDKRAMQLVRFE